MTRFSFGEGFWGLEDSNRSKRITIVACTYGALPPRVHLWIAQNIKRWDFWISRHTRKEYFMLKPPLLWKGYSHVKTFWTNFTSSEYIINLQWKHLPFGFPKSQICVRNNLGPFLGCWHYKSWGKTISKWNGMNILELDSFYYVHVL